MTNIKWLTFADMSAKSVASDVAAEISTALSARGHAFVALPGGKTPIAAFEILAQADLDWRRVTIVPTDIRLVPEDNPLNNAAMIRRILGAVGARVLSMARTESAKQDMNYRDAGRSADADLAGLPWPTDLIWLGIGADGHTASIFPGPDLVAALDQSSGRRAVGVMPDPLPAEAPVARVTLTKAAILLTRALMIVLSGKEKRKVLEQAIVDAGQSAVPIGRVLAGAQVPVHIYWSAA